jgi:hypothetical protein
MHLKPFILTGLVLASPAYAFSQAAQPQSSQPADERAAQNALPMSHDTTWGTLLKAKITYSSTAPHIRAAIPADIKSLNGQTLTLSGFVLPMDSQEKTTHFLLSKRTPTCPFCPPGEPNEVVEVYSKQAIPYNDQLLTMRGTFTLTNNTEQGIFFVLKNAQPVKPKASWIVPAAETPL